MSDCLTSSQENQLLSQFFLQFLVFFFSFLFFFGAFVFVSKRRKENNAMFCFNCVRRHINQYKSDYENLQQIKSSLKRYRGKDLNLCVCLCHCLCNQRRGGEQCVHPTMCPTLCMHPTVVISVVVKSVSDPVHPPHCCKQRGGCEGCVRPYASTPLL
jgi:hypothetical protein